jgi:diguanylate cyclase (GGDEF)-like protein/putative nucleotidyltransferase with HDIG domain
MRDWYKKTSNKIEEYLIITHITTYLIYLAAVFMIINRLKVIDPNNLYFGRGAFLISFAFSLLLYLVLYKYKGQILSLKKPTLANYIFVCCTILIIIILNLFGSKYIDIKMLFFMPVILAALNYDKIYRTAVTALCSFALLFINVVNNFKASNTYDAFDSDILLIGIIFLINWLIGNLRNIELETQQYLENLANYDDLTGLANHRHFQEVLSFELEQACVNNANLALIMMDIDYFKFYNDTYGHQQGDEVLKEIGKILKAEIGKIGIAARYGGEEFAIILPGLTAKQAVVIADTLRSNISAHDFYGAELLPQGRLTISCGIAGYPEHADNKKELIRSADEALYKAKNSAKNKVELYFTVFNELGNSVRKNEQDLINSVRTLVSIINAKDRYTYGHSERVALYAQELAKEIGLTENQIKCIAYGAFLHDIGKIEISRDILNKTTVLTAEERHIFNQHPVWGAEIVKPIRAFRDISPLILHHHENFDGTGYPSGLKGAAIPLEARILRIADSFDAMTTNRPYKTAMEREAALEELRRCSGTQFDPHLVEHFIRLFTKGKLEKNLA